MSLEINLGIFARFASASLTWKYSAKLPSFTFANFHPPSMPWHCDVYPRMQFSQWKHGVIAFTATRSPSRTLFTSRPTFATMPTASCPSVRFSRSPIAPLTVCVSDVQTSARVVLMIASFGPGSGGSGLSRKPTSPIRFITKARIVSSSFSASLGDPIELDSPRAACPIGTDSRTIRKPAQSGAGTTGRSQESRHDDGRALTREGGSKNARDGARAGVSRPRRHPRAGRYLATRAGSFAPRRREGGRRRRPHRREGERTAEDAEEERKNTRRPRGFATGTSSGAPTSSPRAHHREEEKKRR